MTCTAQTINYHGKATGTPYQGATRIDAIEAALRAYLKAGVVGNVAGHKLTSVVTQYNANATAIGGAVVTTVTAKGQDLAHKPAGSEIYTFKMLVEGRDFVDAYTHTLSA